MSYNIIDQSPTITESGMLPRRIVLVELGPDHHVTWQQADEPNGTKTQFWGHYFTDAEKARADFEKRAYELLNSAAQKWKPQD
jgi:hypothetical protein